MRRIVTSPSANDPTAFALFCNPESRRVEGFTNATLKLLRQRPALVSWLSVLERKPWLETIKPSSTLLRLESPGRNWPVERALLLSGAKCADAEASCGWRGLPAEAVLCLEHDPGRIHPMRQWFLGWRSALAGLECWARAAGKAEQWLCPPADVICMFDKAECQRRLEAEGIAVPPALGVPRNFDELWEMVRRTGRRRIFLKPCHGSSASGIVALETSGAAIQAFTTVDSVQAPDGLRLYNQRRINVRRGAGEVRSLVDAVCRERCLAQVWVPKAGLHGRTFDVRILVVGGRARHVMVRLGRGPMTNSQLLGGKGTVELLRQRMGEDPWSAMLALCERAAEACFPRSLYAAFDVLVEPNFRTARILEVNAFGDLLPRLLHEGRTTYEWEVDQALRLRQPDQVSSMGS